MFTFRPYTISLNTSIFDTRAWPWRREEATFDVEPDALEAAYRQLQRVIHPDKFTTASQVWPRPPAQVIADIRV